MRNALAASMIGLAALSGCGSSGEKTHGSEQKDLAKKQWAGARASVLANLAFEQYEGGNFDKCRTTIDDALKIDPDNLALRVLSGKLAIEMGNLELADKELTRSRQIDPRSAEADYLSGVVCQRWQRSQEAYEFYRSAAEKQPTELAYLLARSEMLVTLNRVDEALTLLKAKVVFFEYSGTIRDAVGQLLMQQGKAAEAVEIFHQASILATDDNTIREHLALARYAAKQYREATEDLARLLKDEKYVHRADLHLAMGECFMQLNKARDAREAFESASQASPNQASVWVGLGKAALQLGDLRRAELSLKRALTIEPASSETNLLLGCARLKQDKLDDALASFRKASALDTADAVSVCMVGYILEKQGKNALALREYARALKMHPGDELATRLMAEVQLDK